MSGHMGRERELLAKRQMLEQDAHKKYDELDVIFQQIVETDKKIEAQREKQLIQLGYCLGCGQPLTEGDMCSYGDLCQSCHESLEEETELEQ